jgi:ankyrin repeat protein
VASFAARANRLDSLKILVAHGADLDVANRDGDTPLIKAKQNDRQDVMDYLISAGETK